MLGSIKTLLSYLAGDAGPRKHANDYNRWLVTAALLTRVATVHSEMSEARRKALRTVLQSKFGLDDVTWLACSKKLPQSIVTQSISIILRVSSMKSSTIMAAARSFE